MSDPYHSVKAGRLTFKGGSVASLSKSIHKKHKKSKQPESAPSPDQLPPAQPEQEQGDVAENVYTIDAAKKMNYQELFPVEAKRFGYVPKDKTKDKAKAKAEASVEEALDDRVKKKADRYCK